MQLSYRRLPDEEAGEIPAACVVVNQEAKENEEDIINYAASNVAHYKKLRVVHSVGSIPKSPSGKIMRRLTKRCMQTNPKPMVKSLVLK
ncbi:hypothetical protein GH714_017261 [Hevea brasiliensis]|uniref:AMP-binding enzyme C-terminal domain-containing protein n=1 Tax=Hevea brasiliensis TaxID=3981 RepID=A0A6A6KEJ2_HEVBR|nr:hypothetical protein GH714_017261 [Hevea brasiliensis]